MADLSTLQDDSPPKTATWVSPDHPGAGYTACCHERTASEAFRAACDALRADGWFLGGPDVPEPWTVPKV